MPKSVHMDPIYNMKKEMLRRNLSHKTIKTYLQYVNQFLLFTKNIPLQKLSKKHVREFLFHLQEKNLASSTLNVAHNALRFFMIDILHKGMYLKIKFAKAPKKKVDYLTKEQINQLLQAIQNPKQKLLISLLYGAGLRVSEVVKLKKEYFDFEQMVGWVIKGKGNKDRPFIIPYCLKLELQELCQQSSNYVFVGSKNAHYSVKSVQVILKKYGQKLFNRHIHPHMLRHSFTTHLLESGEDITRVQQLLGHTHPQTTLGYAHYTKVKLITTKSPLDIQNMLCRINTI